MRRRRRRWFVLKDGKILWFKSDQVDEQSVPRGCIDVSCLPATHVHGSLICCWGLCGTAPACGTAHCVCFVAVSSPIWAGLEQDAPGIAQVSKCLSVKGAEDAINKQCAFEARDSPPSDIYGTPPSRRGL